MLVLGAHAGASVRPRPEDRLAFTVGVPSRDRRAMSLTRWSPRPHRTPRGDRARWLARSRSGRPVGTDRNPRPDRARGTEPEAHVRSPSLDGVPGRRACSGRRHPPEPGRRGASTPPSEPGGHQHQPRPRSEPRSRRRSCMRREIDPRPPRNRRSAPLRAPPRRPDRSPPPMRIDASIARDAARLDPARSASRGTARRRPGSMAGRLG
jgi:hypothetical protein